MLAFDQRPGRTDILCDGHIVLSFIERHAFLGQAMIVGLRTRPDGPEEMQHIQPSAFFEHKVRGLRVTCRAKGANELVVTSVPTEVEDGLDRYVAETRTFRIQYDALRRRISYTITADMRFRADIRGNEGLWITTMPQQDGDDYAVVEFDDPLLHGGIGPQVPMTQDWTGVPEPMFGETGFTTAWEKRFTAVLLPTVTRGIRRLAFNRTVNGVQYFYNRSLPVTTPGAPFYYEKADGAYIRFTPLHTHPGSHHICEWGYDMHLYALLKRARKDLLFRKGQRITLSWMFDEVGADELPAAYRKAREAEIVPEERARADRPIYEEPVCRFAESTLNHPDQYPWEPSGAACVWNKKGGKERGSGALEIRHGIRPASSAWSFRHFGASFATNPIPGRSRHRIRAWVMADDMERMRFVFTLYCYQGAAAFSPHTPVTQSIGKEHIVRRSGKWALLDVVTAPTGNYPVHGSFRFEYTGFGGARLSGLRVASV